MVTVDLEIFKVIFIKDETLFHKEIVTAVTLEVM